MATPISSILTSVKKYLGLAEEYDVFDPDIIDDINTVFTTLYQMGVGPKDAPFEISDSSSKWEDFITGPKLNAVRSYMYKKVRLMWDPPTTGSTQSAFEQQCQELEWRLNVMSDPEFKQDVY